MEDEVYELVERKTNQITDKELYTELCIVQKPFLYTVKEVAKLLKTNVDYVYDLKKAKLLPFLKIGSYKVRPEALKEFLIKYEGYDLTDPFNIVRLD